MTPARWRPRLAATLDEIAAASCIFEDDWWLIGSAAAALSGAEIIDVRDVDLLLSENDAERLVAYWPNAIRAAGAGEDQFRSAVFARYSHAPLAIEAFGGFAMKIDSDWRPVVLKSRVSRGGVFTPSISEQIDLLRQMGRAKDHARIRALKKIL